MGETEESEESEGGDENTHPSNQEWKNLAGWPDREPGTSPSKALNSAMALQAAAPLKAMENAMALQAAAPLKAMENAMALQAAVPSGTFTDSLTDQISTGVGTPRAKTATLPRVEPTTPTEGGYRDIESADTLSSEIRDFIGQLRAEIAYRQTCEALQTYGDNLDDRIILFAASQLLGFGAAAMTGTPGLAINALASGFAFWEYFLGRETGKVENDSDS